jgi:hypothetical protein
MKCSIKLTMAAALVAILACNAQAANSVFFAYSNTDPTITAQPAWHAITGTGAVKKVYVWISSNAGSEITPNDLGITPVVISGTTNYVPNSGAGIDLNYTSTGSTFSMTGAQDYQYTLTGTNTDLTGSDVNGSVRNHIWDQVSNYTVTTTSITGVNAVTVATAKDTTFAATNISRGFYAGNNTAANVSNPNPAFHTTAWLLGEVDFTTAAYGTQTITISPFSATNSVVRGTTDLTASYTYGSASITISQLAGDLNGDGSVGLADLNLVYNNFGSPYGLSDLNNVFNNFGTGNGQFSTVPEPASLALLGFGGLAMLGGWKIRRRRAN